MRTMRDANDGQLAIRLLVYFNKARTDAIDVIFAIQSTIKIESRIISELYRDGLDEFRHRQRPLAQQKKIKIRLASSTDSWLTDKSIRSYVLASD
ncbi:hypothetical protein ACHAQJ_006316 [Trichoderma viride]